VPLHQGGERSLISIPHEALQQLLVGQASANLGGH
jgi:hypothetical protein